MSTADKSKQVAPQKGDLRIWWIPQIPMKPFNFPVGSVPEGLTVLRLLAAYDKFQFENNIKPDYCNAGGLQTYDPEDIENDDPETGWTDWYDEETGKSAGALLRARV